MHGIEIEIKKPVIGGFVFDDLDFIAFPTHPTAERVYGLCWRDAVVFSMQEQHGWEFATQHFGRAQGLCL